MCNLYRMTKTTDEVSKWFDAESTAHGTNIAAEIYPGYPGLVIADAKLRSMTWGFPLSRKGANGQLLKPKPVNNARTDKLHGYFWRPSFEQRRCLIPISAWAEAQGERGSMTRTWMSMPQTDMFACAGVWRSSEEWGNVYSMVMVGSSGDAAQIHSRMPVILAPEHYDQWLGADVNAAMALCQPWSGGLVIDPTTEPWSKQSQANLL
ncbi:MAG: SOS response-associated peptidase family protein [Pontixanthobacter sp.]